MNEESGRRVMRLHGSQDRFELTLGGRPDLDGWCEIRVVVEARVDHWTATSRCLLGEEVSWLADWLEAAAADPTLAGYFVITTLDNMINFELIEGEPRLLRIYLEWDLRPPRLREIPPLGEFYQEYPVTEQVLRRAAASLRQQLATASKRNRV
jgi:hypothetical protein